MAQTQNSFRLYNGSNHLGVFKPEAGFMGLGAWFTHPSGQTYSVEKIGDIDEQGNRVLFCSMFTPSEEKKGEWTWVGPSYEWDKEPAIKAMYEVFLGYGPRRKSVGIFETETPPEIGQKVYLTPGLDVAHVITDTGHFCGGSWIEVIELNMGAETNSGDFTPKKSR